jgi:hypothetical protein
LANGRIGKCGRCQSTHHTNEGQASKTPHSYHP